MSDELVISLSMSCFRPHTCPPKPCGWCWRGATMTCVCWTCPAKHWKLKAFLEVTRYMFWCLNCSFLVFVLTCYVVKGMEGCTESIMDSCPVFCSVVCGVSVPGTVVLMNTLGYVWNQVYIRESGLRIRHLAVTWVQVMLSLTVLRRRLLIVTHS